jgi:uncharacterized protein (TIGR02118 family)
MGLLNKRDDWSMERFRSHWREHHARLASAWPGLVAYHQNHVTDSVQRGINYKRGPEHVDGISQLWFDETHTHPESLRQDLAKELIQDEQHFLGQLRIVSAECNEVIAPPAPGTALKRMSFLRRRPDVSVEQFADEWRIKHAQWVKTLPGVLGYRQNLITHRESPKGHVVDHGGLPIDGIVELWFDNPDTLDAAFASPQGVKTMQHATEFIDEITTFLVDEHVVK